MTEERGNGVAEREANRNTPVSGVLQKVLTTPTGERDVERSLILGRVARQFTGPALNLMFFYILAGVVAFLWAKPDELGLSSIVGRWTAIAIAVLVPGAVLLVRGKKANKAASKADVGVEKTDPAGIIVGRKARNDVLIDNYHAMTVRHARSAFRNSQMAMAAGLAVLVTGAIVVIQSPEWPRQLVVGGLAAIGSTFSGFLTRTFNRSHDKAVDQVNRLFSQPLVSYYLEYSREVAKELSSERLRDKALDRVVDRALESANASVPGAARKRKLADTGEETPPA